MLSCTCAFGDVTPCSPLQLVRVSGLSYRNSTCDLNVRSTVRIHNFIFTVSIQMKSKVSLRFDNSFRLSKMCSHWKNAGQHVPYPSSTRDSAWVCVKKRDRAMISRSICVNARVTHSIVYSYPARAMKQYLVHKKKAYDFTFQSLKHTCRRCPKTVSVAMAGPITLRTVPVDDPETRKLFNKVAIFQPHINFTEEKTLSGEKWHSVSTTTSGDTPCSIKSFLVIYHLCPSKHDSICLCFTTDSIKTC